MEPRGPVRRLARPLLDWLAPPRCAGCGRVISPPLRPLCPACEVSLVELPNRCCPCCGHPGAPTRCGSCRDHPPPFTRARSAYVFGGELARAIRRLKYGRQLELGLPLGALLWPMVRQASGRVDVVIPVPTTPRELGRRGFSQVVELLRGARLCGGELPPLERSVLQKRRGHRPQASLCVAERRQLSAAAFRVVRQDRIGGRSLLLVDDVWTTGATARAASRALLRAGAARVEVVTLARVV